MTKYSFQTLLALVAILLGGVAHSGAQIVAGDSATTPTCASWGYRGPSVASPPDGAVYRVGEPVIFEPDTEFATGSFCGTGTAPEQLPGPTSPARRRIVQEGIGAPIGDDTHEVFYFNVPGTIAIDRSVSGTFPTPRTGWKINTITIIDDGPRPFPEPVSAPPGEKVPRIEASGWWGNPVKPVYYSVITEDNSFSQLRWTEVKNTGDSPLVISRIFNWIGIQHNTVYPKDAVFPLVILPGQVKYIPFGQDLHNPESYLENIVRYEHLVIESNDPVRPFALITHAERRIFPSVIDIPDDYPYSPPPVVRDNYVCNDTNNDGVIDVGDIVTSILRSAP